MFRPGKVKIGGRASLCVSLDFLTSNSMHSYSVTVCLPVHQTMAMGLISESEWFLSSLIGLMVVGRGGHGGCLYLGARHRFKEFRLAN